ncbi:hypothetical protein JQ554_32965 [Bradyrhizobium diazoefficiens]|nr:hypothetical protein [Bradyrhizobium diazoefficiens]UCF51390.1 MAG: hypothetical protein JSV48_18210 [Bradyrhizobium sp.]MBR0968833.1 hypothetical protein [Bradyrhizobium diazoefficiens]MBR0982198.1 hypothetical protein [Bradyrhizobium diazoefficiens]MBR1011652.1 hypothetical protein [Bradyrhizobium diazoefficiens]MBR1018121.1 hypothetical protein [Bradyrhizobium diazoefficiens]
MSTRITLSIKARGDTDSPTVEDLLDQLRDYFDILKGVEEALAEDGTSAIQWRIVNATKNSPIQVTAEASAKTFAVDVARRAELTTRYTATGLQLLRLRGERPPYFNDKVMLKAERFFERVTNGLDETKIAYADDHLPDLDITPRIAREAAANVRSALKPPDKPYKEIGSVEGTPRTIGRDGHRRLVMWLRERLTGEDVKCILTGEAEEELGEHQIKEVWQSRRLRVFGTLHFKGRGKLNQVDGTQIKFFRDRSDLPDVEDILDEDFTGGLSSEEYLKRLRDGELS